MSAISDAILSLSPSGYWRLGEASGTTAYDSSGNGLSGTYSGTYTLGSGSLAPSDPDNLSLSVSGAGYVSIPNSAKIVTNAAFTFFGRFARSTPTGDQTIFHKGNHASSGNQGVSLSFKGGTNNLVVSWFNGIWYSSTFSNVISGTSAHSIFFIYGGGTSLKLIVNGTNIYTATAATALPTSSFPLLIGAGMSGSIYPSLVGGVDECFWVPSALTDAQAEYIHSVLIDATPKYAMVSKSTFAFMSGVRFSIGSSSNFSLETSDRSFSMQSSSSLIAKTNQRNFSFVSSSIFGAVAGSGFKLSSISSLDYHALSAIPSSAPINTSSVASFAGEAISTCKILITSKTNTKIKGGYNAMTRAVVSSKSIVGATLSTLSKSEFYTSASTILSFAPRLVKQTSYSIGASSQVATNIESIKTADIYFSCGSVVALVGRPTKRAFFSYVTNTDLQFYSNNITSPLLNIEFSDVFFVKTSSPSIFIGK